MSIIGNFVRRREPEHDKETYIEENVRFPVAVAPQLPPEQPIQSLTPGTRRAKMPVVFFFHPASQFVQEDTFTWKARLRKMGAALTGPAMSQAAWGARFNIRRPIPSTFGEQFELGGEEE